MLALDSTLGCMEVSESDVVDLYRSAPITRSSDQRSDTMEAYIYAIRRKALVKVYFALVVNDHKIYVYSSPGKGKREQEYPEEIEKSLSYANAMGFRPERVDLSYSPAMREVVVRNTKVLRLPGSKGAGLKHGLAGAPVLPMLSKSGPTAVEPAAQTIPVPAPAVAATAVSATQQSDGGELLAALARMQHEQQALTAERDALARQLQQLSTQQREATDELVTLRKASEDMAGAKDALRSQQRQTDQLLAAKDAAIAELGKRVADLVLEREALTTQNAKLSRTHDAMLDNLALARQDIAALSAQRDAALADSGAALQQHRDAVTQLDQARLDVEKVAGEAAGARQRIEELEESARSKEQELDALRRELAEANSERDTALQRLAAQSAEAGTDAEAELLRRELGQVGAERDAALARLATRDEQQAREVEETQAHLRRELERAQGERDTALQRVAVLEERQEAELAQTPGREPEWKRGQHERPETLKEAAPPTFSDADNTGCKPGEEAFTSRILPGIQHAAAEPLPAFTESTLPPFSELQTPSEMGHPWDSTAEVAEVGGEAPPEPVPSAEESGGDVFGEQETSFVSLGDLQDGFFSAGDDDAPVRFLFETGRDAIDCPSADDVLELHQSINNAYLSPEGTGGQESCQGYICCLRKGEDKVVVAAIYGTKSHRTRVYLPEAQPRDEDSYARTVRGAISFAEEVGLMMERVPLEATGPKRQERLKRCPALRLT